MVYLSIAGCESKWHLLYRGITILVPYLYVLSAFRDCGTRLSCIQSTVGATSWKNFHRSAQRRQYTRELAFCYLSSLGTRIANIPQRIDPSLVCFNFNETTKRLEVPKLILNRDQLVKYLGLPLPELEIIYAICAKGCRNIRDA